MSAADELVVVKRTRSSLNVSFPFHPEAAKQMARVEGAEFDQKSSRWVLPLAAGEKADKAIESVRHILAEDRKARAALEGEIKVIAAQLSKGNGVADAPLRISDFHDRTRATVGDIVAANSEYAAQFTGFGRDDGAVFVTMHRQADLDRQLFKDNRVAISYNEKGKASVADIAPDFDKALGKVVDGVKVLLTGNAYLVSFPFHPDMVKRLNRVDGASYDRERGATVIPVDKREFLVRAVNDMRSTFLKSMDERATLAQVAENSLSDAKVHDAYRDGQATTGQIVGVSEHFVLQHVGKADFRLHYKSDLDVVPDVGKQARIKYENGKGKAQLVTRGQEAGYGR